MITYTNEAGQVIRAEIGSRGAAVLEAAGYKGEFQRAAEARRMAGRERLEAFKTRRMDEKRRQDAEIWADTIAPSVAPSTATTTTPAAVAPAPKEDLFQ